MRKIILLFLVLIATQSAASAQVSSTSSGFVSYVVANDNGSVLFNFSGTRSTPPNCQSATAPTRWAIDATTPTGQAKLATLLTAYALHKQMVIVGKGDCAVWGDTETVNYFFTIE